MPMRSKNEIFLEAMRGTLMEASKVDGVISIERSVPSTGFVESQRHPDLLICNGMKTHRTTVEHI